MPVKVLLSAALSSKQIITKLSYIRGSNYRELETFSMKRKKVTLLVTFVFLSMLAACITVPILYSKSWRDSRTTMPSTSVTTTKTGHLTSNKVDETTLSYETSAPSKYSTVAVTTAAIASTTASIEGSSTKPLITIGPTTSKSNSTSTTTTQSAAQSTTATPRDSCDI